MSKQVPFKVQRPWLLYLLECTGGKLYAGISPDPEARFRMHLRGTGAKYTRANPPLRILAAQAYPSRAAASAAEHALKKMRRPAKLLWAQQHTWPLRRAGRVPKGAAAKAAGGKAAPKAARPGFTPPADAPATGRLPRRAPSARTARR